MRLRCRVPAAGLRSVWVAAAPGCGRPYTLSIGAGRAADYIWRRWARFPTDTGRASTAAGDVAACNRSYVDAGPKPLPVTCAPDGFAGRFSTQQRMH